MHYSLLFGFCASAFAARPFLNEPNTAYYAYLNNTVGPGELPPLELMESLYDYDKAAQNYLAESEYAYYRTGTGGEWSYRNNLESFMRIPWKPRMMRNISGLRDTMETTILGYNFSSPFFVAPAARAAYLHPDAELNYVRAAFNNNVLYVPSQYASKSPEEINEARLQVASDNDGEPLPYLQQLYIDGNNMTADMDLVERYANLGAQGFIVTVDAPASSNRVRGARYGVSSANDDVSPITWDYLRQLQAETGYPMIPKGILSVDDVKIAVEQGYDAVYVSNHGGRQVDGQPSPFEVCQEIYHEDPTLFSRIDIWADGGVRYGGDALKFLALGVKMVGVGRGFAYPNVYGAPGVDQAMRQLQDELFNDAAAVGVEDFKSIPQSILNFNYGYPRYRFA